RATRPSAAAEWLDDPSRFAAHVRRQPEGRLGDVRGGHANELGEPSGIEVALLERAAHRLAATPTVVALAARHVVRGHDTVAADDVVHAGPDLDDVADHLVTEDGGRLGVRRDDLGDVGAAETAPAQAQQQLTRADRWPRPVFGHNPAVAPEDGRLHARSALTRPLRGGRSSSTGAQWRSCGGPAASPARPGLESGGLRSRGAARDRSAP